MTKSFQKLQYICVINLTYGIRTNNAELKNISVKYSRVLPTEPRRQLIAN